MIRSKNKPVRANTGTPVKGATPRNYESNYNSNKGDKANNRSVPFTNDIPVSVKNLKR